MKWLAIGGIMNPAATPTMMPKGTEYLGSKSKPKARRLTSGPRAVPNSAGSI